MDVFLVQINASFCVTKTREAAEQIRSNLDYAHTLETTTTGQDVFQITQLPLIEDVADLTKEAD